MPDSTAAVMLMAACRLKAQQQVGFYNISLPSPQSICDVQTNPSLTSTSVTTLTTLFVTVESLNNCCSYCCGEDCVNLSSAAVPDVMFVYKLRVNNNDLVSLCANLWIVLPNHRLTKATACLSPSRRVHSHHGGGSAR